MNAEQPPPPETLDTYLLHGRSLQAWYDFLTVDPETGEPTGDLPVPCSRYGRTGAEVAWFSIACEVVYVVANGEADDDAEEALDYLQGLAVNDHDSIIEVVYEYWHSLPRALRRKLGTKKEIEAMLP